MRSYVDTRTLDGHLLQFHALGPGSFGARVGGLTAGEIALKISRGGQRWCWSVTGPLIPSILQPQSGEADTLAAAQAEFRAKFDAWRRWAQGSPALWAVEAARSA